MSTLGIDIGTTGCKVGAFSEEGAQIGFACRTYELCRPKEGWCELPATHVWNQLCVAIREVAAATSCDPVKALCVSSLGEAVTPVDIHGTILANSIVSSDIRGGEYAGILQELLSAKEFYAINPNVISPNYSYPKIAWLRDNHPEIYEKTDKFLLWDGLVSRMLGGKDFASYSLANRTLLFDIHTQTWSDKLLDICGIERTKLPVCMSAGSFAGEVRHDIALNLGLPKNVKIIVGGHDQCVNALGCGIVHPGRSAVGIGTYECITPVYSGLSEYDKIRCVGLNIEHYLLPDMYVSFLFNQGGSLINWFNRVFAGDKSGGRIHSIQDEMPIDPTRLLVLPYFEPTGSPDYVNDASGVIVGLKMDTSRGEILKAIMESTSFYFLNVWRKLAMEQSVKDMIASGGGARSDKWLQIKANIFGVPVLRPKVRECGILGGAMLAMAAIADIKREDSLRQLSSQWVSFEKSFEPDSKQNTAYCERFDHYQELFPALKRNLGRWHDYLQKCS